MNLNDFARPEHVAALAPTVAAALLKGAVILVLGTVCSLLARGASAAARHMIWTLTLGGALAVPAITALVPRWTLHVGFWPVAAHEVPVAASELTVPAALTGASTNAVLALAPRTGADMPGAASSLGDGGATTLVQVAADTSSPSVAITATAERATTTLEVRHVTVPLEASVAAAPASADVPRAGALPLMPWLVAVWGLGVTTHPSKVACLGGKYFFDDDQHWPDTQYAVFEYPESGKSGKRRQLIFEQRIWSPYVQEGYENGAAFYGTKGVLILGHSVGFQVFGQKNKPGEKGSGSADLVAHHTNFIECVRSGKRPNADVEEGHLSACLVHLANIACRQQKTLHFDPAKEVISDVEANKLVRRTYRDGHWAVPKGV